jgi:hypothetical protein
MKKMILLLFITTTLNAETLILDSHSGILVLSDSPCRESFEGSEYFKSGLIYATKAASSSLLCWRRDNGMIIVRFMDDVHAFTETAFRKL